MLGPVVGKLAQKFTLQTIGGF